MTEENSVIPWSQLDTAQVPGGGELRLLRRGAEFSIKLDQNELMNSRLSATEQALATIALRQNQDRERPHILIGGLGMGFTLRAALTVLGQQAQIIVAELVPAVVAWARGPMARLFGESLTDPRVRIHEADVGDLIRSGARRPTTRSCSTSTTGPTGMTRKANDGSTIRKDCAPLMRRCVPAACWRYGRRNPIAKFTKRLRKTGFDVVENPVRAKGPQGGAQHFIWTATRPA